MANPRKFSEKIALHTQKQAEETAAFEQIMKEVGFATRGPEHTFPLLPHFSPHRLMVQPTLSSYGRTDTLCPPGQRYPCGITPPPTNQPLFHGGSLPNVNNRSGQHAVQRLTPDMINGPHIDLQGALDTLNDMKYGNVKIDSRARGASLSKGTRARSSHNENRKTPRADCSPYASPYLSPPSPNAHWRRTNSDSALHQTGVNGDPQSVDSSSLSPSPPAIHTNSLKIPTLMSSPNRPAYNINNNKLSGYNYVDKVPVTDMKSASNGRPNHTSNLAIKRRKEHSFPPLRYNSTGCMLKHVGIMPTKIQHPLTSAHRPRVGYHNHLTTSSSSSDMLKLCMSHIYLNKIKQQIPNPTPEDADSDRPKSCEVPGINIITSNPYPLNEGNVQVVPLNNNTGSLPDLSTLHFPSPLSTPIDNDDYINPYESHSQTSIHDGGGSYSQIRSAGPISPAYSYLRVGDLGPQSHNLTQYSTYYNPTSSGSLAYQRSTTLGSSSPHLTAPSNTYSATPYSDYNSDGANKGYATTPGLHSGQRSYALPPISPPAYYPYNPQEGLTNPGNLDSHHSNDRYYLDENNNLRSLVAFDNEDSARYYQQPYHLDGKEWSQSSLSQNKISGYLTGSSYHSYNSSIDEGLNKDPMMGFYDIDSHSKPPLMGAYSASLAKGSKHGLSDLFEITGMEQENDDQFNGNLQHNKIWSNDGQQTNIPKNINIENSSYINGSGPDRLSASTSRHYQNSIRTGSPIYNNSSGLLGPIYDPSHLINPTFDFATPEVLNSTSMASNRRSRSQDNKSANDVMVKRASPNITQADWDKGGYDERRFNSYYQINPSQKTSHSLTAYTNLNQVGRGRIDDSVKSNGSSDSTFLTSDYHSNQDTNAAQYHHYSMGTGSGYPLSSSYTNISGSASSFDALPLAELALEGPSGDTTEDFYLGAGPNSTSPLNRRSSPLTSLRGLGSPEMAVLMSDSTVSECCIGDLLMDTIVMGGGESGGGSSSTPSSPHLQARPTITVKGADESLELKVTLLNSEINHDHSMGGLDVDEFLENIAQTSPSSALNGNPPSLHHPYPTPPRSNEYVARFAGDDQHSEQMGNFNHQNVGSWGNPSFNFGVNYKKEQLCPTPLAKSSYLPCSPVSPNIPHIILTGADDKLSTTVSGDFESNKYVTNESFGSIYDKTAFSSSDCIDMASNQ